MSRWELGRACVGTAAPRPLRCVHPGTRAEPYLKGLGTGCDHCEAVWQRLERVWIYGASTCERNPYEHGVP